MTKYIYKNLRIGIIGAGRVGGNLAFWLSRSGWRIAKIYSRSESSAKMVASSIPTGVASSVKDVLRTCDVAFITVPDDAIVPVLEEISEHKPVRVKTLVHCAGCLPSSLLAIAGMEFAKVSIHPMSTIPPLSTKANPFRNIFFGVEGDEFAVKMAEQMVSDLDAKHTLVDTEKKPLYHTAGVFASNFLYVMAHIAQDLLIQSGIDDNIAKKVTITFIKRALRNLLRFGLPEGMTGPISRGDVRTVETHIKALKETEYLHLYVEASRIAAKIVDLENLFAQSLEDAQKNGHTKHTLH